MQDSVQMSDRPELQGRRPLASRQLRVVRRFAAWLADKGVTPNAISVSSMIFATLAGSLFAATAHLESSLGTSVDSWAWLARRAAWLLGALCVQARLLANLFDGLVAVEGGKASALGEIYNEAPDRYADTVILCGLGLSVGGSPLLGVLASLLAVGVAYVRALGASAGAGQAFAGPMAKPQRMFLVTLTSAYCGLAPESWHGFWTPGSVDPSTDTWSTPAFALSLIALGCVVTLPRRLRWIARRLEENA